MIFEIVFTSSVLIVGIFIIRKLFLGKISMRLRYMLWLLAAVRLLLPVSVGTSPISAMNLFSEIFGEDGGIGVIDGAHKVDGKEFVFYRTQTAAVPTEDGEEEIQSASANPAKAKQKSGTTSAWGGQSEPAQEKDTDQISPTEGFSVTLGLGMLWLPGVLAVGGGLFIMRLRFVRWLSGHRQQIPEEHLPGPFAEYFAKRGIKVYLVKNLPSPCLVGRQIYVGERALADTQQFSHILAHEYCHAVHGDTFWAFLRCVLAVVYWFDPFVWAAAFAARQDSELACDEAAVQLLGEEQRFSYGRTLLSLMEIDEGREKCPGMSFMTEGGERNVKERILSLTKTVKTRGTSLTAVLATVVFLGGCAFTGADQKVPDFSNEAAEQTNGAETAQTEETFVSQNPQMTDEGKKEESARIQKEYDGARNQIDETERQIKAAEEAARQAAEQAAKQAAFEEVLNYHGVMEGKDDNELTLNRELDLQAYYNYLYNTEQEAVENPLEEGWYLLFYNEREEISLYGLYTEEFGFRGIKMKMMAGGDVNTWDIKWCPSYFNLDIDNRNIRVLERESNGQVRRLVWKILEEETSKVEIWRLYTGYRYDTGTIDVKELTQEEYLAWAGQHLSFAVDQEAGKVIVTYDKDTVVGALDISAYQEYEVEDVQICTDSVSFDLNDNAFGKEVYDDYDGVVLHLVVGLKLKGSDEIWIDGMPPLAVQVVQDENGGFRLQQPAIAEPYMVHRIDQERSLAKLPKRTGE